MNQWPQTVLMVTPDFFNIEYSINPHMLDKNGKLNQVNRDLAVDQWKQLKKTFENCNMKVEVLQGVSQLPDMVFCANQTFPFIKDEKKQIVMSRMNSPQRQPEVAYFKKWAIELGYLVHEIQSSSFEGMGDALWNYEAGFIMAGYGFRTSLETYQELENIVGQKIYTLELKDPRFYHLDTCLAILNKDTAAYVPEAFTAEGLKTLESNIKNLIAIPLTEAIDNFAGNMCSLNGKDIVMQKGAEKTKTQLKELGFTVFEVETSEFMKSGGSVFCMKQLLF